jgi:hypothetical protein
VARIAVSESVAGERATNAADIAVFQVNAGGDALRDFFRATVGCAGDAAADGLPKDKNIGRQFPLAGASARARANGVSFIGDKQRTVAARKRLRGRPVSVVGQDDTDVGHGGLSENAGYVVVLQRGLQRW